MVPDGGLLPLIWGFRANPGPVKPDSLARTPMALNLNHTSWYSARYMARRAGNGGHRAARVARRAGRTGTGPSEWPDGPERADTGPSEWPGGPEGRAPGRANRNARRFPAGRFALLREIYLSFSPPARAAWAAARRATGTRNGEQET
jgi:hypothetical protein